MYRILLIFFPLAWAQLAAGQSFYPLPGPLVEREVTPEQANECFIYFENPGGDTLHLRWRKVESTFPTEWDIDLCDYGNCYSGIPASGSMNPVHDTLRAYLKLIVQPATTPGAGWLWFRVWEATQPANFADVFFSLHTPGVAAAEEARGEAFRAFPNPANAVLFVENRSETATFARLFDATGVLKWASAILPGSQTSLDVNHWSPGLYFIQTDHTTQSILLSR